PAPLDGIAPDPGVRARLELPRTADPLEALAGQLIGDLLPLSLLEGFQLVEREATRRYGRPVHAVVGNYGIDETQNVFLARCRAAGKRIAFAQPGGMYLQSPVNAQERLELDPDSTFLSWGGSRKNAIPTPNAYLEHL